jgi:hypothetical protein
MPQLVASALDALGRVPDAAVAAFLTALPAWGLRGVLRLLLDRDRPRSVLLGRLLAAGVGLGAGAALGPIGMDSVGRSRPELIAAASAAVAVLSSAALPAPRAPALSATGCPAVAALLAAAAGLVLLPRSFLRASAEAPLVTVELTGESRREIVRWAPPGQPAREDGFRAHRLLLRSASGAEMGEAWLFGRTATLVGADYGGGLRFHELRNDAASGGATRLYPPKVVRVEPRGPAAVPPWWREVQERLLLSLGVVPAATASPPLVLVDEQGLPRRATYALDRGADGRLILR